MHLLQSICFKTSILGLLLSLVINLVSQPNNDPLPSSSNKTSWSSPSNLFLYGSFLFSFQTVFCHNSRNWLPPLVIIKILWSPSIKFHVCHRPLAIPVIVACLALRTFSIGSRYKLVQVCLQRNIKITLNLGWKLKAYLHHKLQLKTCLIQHFLSAFKVFFILSFWSMNKTNVNQVFFLHIHRNMPAI